MSSLFGGTSTGITNSALAAAPAGAGTSGLPADGSFTPAGGFSNIAGGAPRDERWSPILNKVSRNPPTIAGGALGAGTAAIAPAPRSDYSGKTL